VSGRPELGKEFIQRAEIFGVEWTLEMKHSGHKINWDAILKNRLDVQSCGFNVKKIFHEVWKVAFAHNLQLILREDVLVTCHL
jgi:hypothetical protein